MLFASPFWFVTVQFSQAGVGSAMTTVQRDGTAHNMQYFEFVVRVNLIGTFSVASKCASWMAKVSPCIRPLAASACNASVASGSHDSLRSSLSLLGTPSQ